MAEAVSVAMHLIARTTPILTHFAGENTARLQNPTHHASGIVFNYMLKITVCLQ